LPFGLGLRRVAQDFLARAIAIVWLCGTGSAWAGDGGADAGTIQSFLNTICGNLGITPCPQLPTVTQGTLEIAGLGYARPEAIRRSQNVSPGSVFASNPPPIPGNPVVPVTLPVTPRAFSNLALTPLAFISPRHGAPSTPNAFAPVAQLFDPDANSFFYAVTTYGNVGGNPQPQVLNLFYDDLSRNFNFFFSGQQVAKLSIPLVVYDSNACATNPPAGCTQTEVMAVLDVRATCTGGANCLTAYALADLSALGTQKCRSLLPAQRCTAADLGVSFTLVFGATPTSSFPHAIFEVQVPLIVTVANDPVHFNAFFNSPQANLSVPPTFGSEDLGSPLAFLPGKVIGVATYPAPLCPGGTPCPKPQSNFQSNFGFCASLPDNIGIIRPAVAAFLDIATDGEVLASAPLGESSSPSLQCPF
jgi:hypothetical protein